MFQPYMAVHKSPLPYTKKYTRYIAASIVSYHMGYTNFKIYISSSLTSCVVKYILRT